MTLLIGGVELGGTKCVLAVAKSPIDILYRAVIPTGNPQKTLQGIFDFFSGYELNRIGIGTFGPVILDSESKNYGLLISESKKGWKGINLFKEFSSNSKAKINIDTDVNAAAIGEYNYGAGRSCQALIYITIGTGIGGGVLVDGKSYTGNFHLEMGHIQVPNPDNFEGVCRIHGDCWEGLASGPSIEARWGVSPLELPESHQAWEKEAELLASGIVSIIANHSPDRVILGGGVMKQKHLFSMIRSKVGEMWNDYTPLASPSELIVEPGLGSDSGIIGALVLGIGGPAQI
ncbi:MAG: ROK family protein [Candidatus Poseidoniia archaeon]|nr:ROK family protein [Candidatus Poseidoniia archaeon]MDP6591525.1 ROK family protein [Candidatus Poseidoniia archaeon]MDP7095897.1 ROK family protein [Candidatus Poseidoniia archaeon]MDP7444084.1 ROK family protein [Candidatus Poseidoniia archaeon]MDP7665731.1 ROK family protein [Candidatus Poseidoniia archaeon]|tara:strand:- start:171 stop:1037 length:867 start_codon:yes stop_codon:yes gene_type:complete